MDKPENFLETTLLNIRAERLAGELIRFLEGRIESGSYHEGEGPYDDPYVIMTAIEGVLCHLMQRFDEEEHFPILSSLLHNTAIKLYEKEVEELNLEGQ
jgi:hypothetical protein